MKSRLARTRMAGIIIMILFITSAEAGLFKSIGKFVRNPIGYTSGKLFGGAVKGSLKPAIGEFGNTLNNSVNLFNANMTDRLNQFNNQIDANLDTFNFVLEERLYQADKIAETRIIQIDEVLAGNIDRFTEGNIQTVERFNSGLSSNIVQFDSALNNNIDRFEVVALKSIDTFNQQFSENIAQFDRSLDETVGQLGIKGEYLTINGTIKLYNTALYVAILTVTILIGILLYRRGYLRNVNSLADIFDKQSTGRFWRHFMIPFVPAIAFLLLIHQIALIGPRTDKNNLLDEYLVPYNRHLHSLNSVELLRNGKFLKTISTDFEHYDLKAKIVSKVFGTLQDPDFSIYLEIQESILDYYDFRGHMTDPDILAIESYMLWNTRETKVEEYFSACKAAMALSDAENMSLPFKTISINYLRNYLYEPLPNDFVHQYIQEARKLNETFEYQEYFSNSDLRNILADLDTHRFHRVYKDYIEFNRITKQSNDITANAYYRFYELYFNPAYKPYQISLENVDSIRNISSKTICDNLEKYYANIQSVNTQNDPLIYFTSLQFDDALFPKMKYYNYDTLTEQKQFIAINFPTVIHEAKNEPTLGITAQDLLPPRIKVDELAFRSFSGISKNYLVDEVYDEFMYKDSLHQKLELDIYKFGSLIHNFSSRKNQSSIVQLITSVMTNMAKLRLYSADKDPMFVEFYNLQRSLLELSEIEELQLSDNFEKLLNEFALEKQYISIFI